MDGPLTASRPHGGLVLARWWRRSGQADPVLLAALLVGTLVRAWGFGALPAGMNQDETAMAYDAFSLFHHGTDRLGIRLPTMLVSWGSGMNPLASYLTAPIVGLFGLHPWSARLPFLLAGAASIPLFYLFLRDTLDLRTARIGAWLLAVSPWHILMSRWGLESNLFPFVFLAAMVLLLRSTQRPATLIPAALVLATSLYAYGTSYFFLPVFMLAALGYGLRHRLWPRRAVLLAAVVFVVAAVPMALNLAVNSLGLPEIHTPFFTVPRMTGTARYQTMVGTGGDGLFSAALVRWAADNLKTGFELFRSQDDGLISNIVPGYGVLYWFSSVLCLMGVALLAARALRRGYQPSFFLVAWSAAGVLLLAVVSVNINRANILWLPFIGCTAIAIEWMARQRPLAVLLGLAFAGSFLGFVATYFGTYHRAGAPQFYASFGEAIRYASHQTDGEICITSRVNQPYVFVLFFNSEDPRTFHQSVEYEDPHANFHTVRSFGRYRFGIDACGNSAPVLIVPRGDAGGYDGARFEAAHFERYSVLTRRR